MSFFSSAESSLGSSPGQDVKKVFISCSKITVTGIGLAQCPSLPLGAGDDWPMCMAKTHKTIFKFIVSISVEAKFEQEELEIVRAS